jgi:hypothetical protein
MHLPRRPVFRNAKEGDQPRIAMGDVVRERCPVAECGPKRISAFERAGSAARRQVDLSIHEIESLLLGGHHTLLSCWTERGAVCGGRRSLIDGVSSYRSESGNETRSATQSQSSDAQLPKNHQPAQPHQPGQADLGRGRHCRREHTRGVEERHGRTEPAARLRRFVAPVSAVA